MVGSRRGSGTMATMNKARATATRGQRNGRAPAGSSRPAGGGGCRRVCRLRRGGEEGDRPGGQRFGFEEVHFGRSRGEGVNALRKRRRRVESWRVAGSPSTNEPLWVKTRERRTLELRLGLALRLFQHPPPPPSAMWDNLPPPSKPGCRPQGGVTSAGSPKRDRQDRRGVSCSPARV